MTYERLYKSFREKFKILDLKDDGFTSCINFFIIIWVSVNTIVTILTSFTRLRSFSNQDRIRKVKLKTIMRETVKWPQNPTRLKEKGKMSLHISKDISTNHLINLLNYSIFEPSILSDPIHILDSLFYGPKNEKRSVY